MYHTIECVFWDPRVYSNVTASTIMNSCYFFPLLTHESSENDGNETGHATLVMADQRPAAETLWGVEVPCDCTDDVPAIEGSTGGAADGTAVLVSRSSFQIASRTLIISIPSSEIFLRVAPIPVDVEGNAIKASIKELTMYLGRTYLSLSRIHAVLYTASVTGMC